MNERWSITKNFEEQIAWNAKIRKIKEENVCRTQGASATTALATGGKRH